MLSAEFEMIINLIREAGAGAQWCFAGYLFYKVLRIGLIFGGVVAIIKSIISGIKKLMETDDKIRKH